MIGLGTIFNVFFILIGSLIGWKFKKMLPDKIAKQLIATVGFFIIFLGVRMVLVGQAEILILLSLISGLIIGELLDLDSKVARFANKLTQQKQKSSQGFITAAILYCVGPMAIVGSFADGLLRDSTVLLTKSIIDGITAIPLTAALGLSVSLSVIPVFIYQGSITVLAYWLQPFFSQQAIAEITSLGGILIIAIAFNLMEIKKVKVANMLPAFLMLLIFVFIRDAIF